MYYLDYAKKVGNRYVLNFFADTIEDLKDVPTTTAYVTRNGTNYGVPLDTSVVTIVEDGIRVNYVLQNGKYIVGGDIPPIVGTKTIIENGTYLAKDDNLEGYSSVTVEVPETASEEKTVELDMANGNQTVSPEEGKLLNKVVIEKPETLVSENIKDGINIGGVVGNLIVPGNRLQQALNKTITGITLDDTDGALYIPDEIFENCKQLTNVELSNSVTKIGDHSFAFCDSLKSITMPDSLTGTDSSAFYGCKIDNVYINNLTNWLKVRFGANNGSPINFWGHEIEQCTKLYLNGTLLEDVIIPNDVDAIQNGLSNYGRLKSIVIPDETSRILDNAFAYCQRLTSVIIGSGVTSINYGAFSRTDLLTNIIIPSKVTSIGGSALTIGSSTNKATITMLPTTPPTIASNTFYAGYLNKIIVPKGTGETYKAATNWAAFADYIEEAAE